MKESVYHSDTSDTSRGGTNVSTLPFLRGTLCGGTQVPMLLYPSGRPIGGRSVSILLYPSGRPTGDTEYKECVCQSELSRLSS